HGPRRSALALATHIATDAASDKVFAKNVRPFVAPTQLCTMGRNDAYAYDRIEATFSAISEIPVQELTQTSGGGEIGTTTFRDAGITLTVTPYIMQDGTVVMKVTPEFSVLAGFQGGNPIIDRRRASTTLQMRDGQTTVIGGLLRRSELEDQTGLPGLSRLKYFGVFFRDHETTVTESELLVFITAEIISPEHRTPPRAEAAEIAASDLLEQVPYASYGPITPYCCDPYCPYHHPRPWGSALPPSACTACGDGTSLGHGVPYAPEYYGPATYYGPAANFGPTAPPQGEPLPAPLAPEHAPSGTIDPPAPAIVPPVPSNGNVPVPPVIVDEARRRSFSRQRTAFRRLPSVNLVPALRTATRTRPVLPSQQATPFAPPQSGIRTANRGARPLPAVGTQRRQSVEQERQAEKRVWWQDLERQRQ
ncbi:MAG TPA: type II and III secretion system protein, partial [Pirellulaceae bacterium]|nr:type II and III secretion system protein [Pirellulaceae bacterium]